MQSSDCYMWKYAINLFTIYFLLFIGIAPPPVQEGRCCLKSKTNLLSFGEKEAPVNCKPSLFWSKIRGEKKWSERRVVSVLAWYAKHFAHPHVFCPSSRIFKQKRDCSKSYTPVIWVFSYSTCEVVLQQQAVRKGDICIAFVIVIFACFPVLRSANCGLLRINDLPSPWFSEWRKRDLSQSGDWYR